MKIFHFESIRFFKMNFLINIFYFAIFLKGNLGEDYLENSKCTEMVGSVEKNILLHVPCILIRLFELVKQCPFESYNQAFLSNFLK